MQFNFGVALKCLFPRYFTNKRIFPTAYFTGPQPGITFNRGAARLAQNIVKITDATAGNVTLTLDQFLGGYWEHSIGATPRTDTTPTAAAIVAALAIGGAQVGDSIDLLVMNPGSAALTMAGGTGVTVRGTAAVAAGTAGCFTAIVTAIGTTPTIDLIRC